MVRTHLYFARESDVYSILELLEEFFDFDEYYKITSSFPVCSYIQQINFIKNDQRIKKTTK
jgi:hypothetical protein